MTLRRLLYSGGEILTTEAVAHAVLELAADLGNRGMATTVLIPAVGLQAGGTVELLLGPASQLTSEPSDSDEVAPDDSTFLDDLRSRLKSDGRTRPWDETDWQFEV